MENAQFSATLGSDPMSMVAVSVIMGSSSQVSRQCGSEREAVERLQRWQSDFDAPLRNPRDNTPLLAHLDGLDLSMGGFDDEAATVLLKSPHLGSLRYLNLRHHFLGQATVEAFRGLGIEVNLADSHEGPPRCEVAGHPERDHSLDSGAAESRVDAGGGESRRGKLASGAAESKDLE